MKQELINFCDQVLHDPAHHCKKEQQACHRFLNDLARSEQNDPEFPYVFDEARAERFCKQWVEKFKHTKGIIVGQPKVFLPLENFIFGNIYGWIHKETGMRRFSKAYWQIGRKNSKSMDLALVALYETFAFLPPIEISETYSAATKSEQSKLIYNEAIALLRSNPMFAKKYKVAYNRIIRSVNSSFMRPLSKDDGKTGDGLNAQCVCLDEYHAHQTTELYDVLRNSQGSRAQPLFMVITTAGHDLSYPCYRVEYDLCSKILSGESKLEHYFVMINELDKNDAGVLVDNIKDQECWIKANPILCSYHRGVEGLKMEMQESVEQPEKMTEFLTKRMNVWVHQPESYYLNMDKWALCKGEIVEPIKSKVFIGIDLAAKIDLTSVGIEYEIDDKYYVLSHSFMPEETLDARRKRDKAPYDLWVRDGYITITPGSAVEYKTVVEWLINAITINGWAVEEIGIDPWGKQSVESALTEAGYKVVDVIQGIKTLSEPTKNFRELVYQGKVIHDGNPVLTWAIGNACARNMDHNENIMLDKNRSRGRIDPIAALMNAHTRLLTTKYTPQKFSTEGKVWFI